MSVVAAIAIVVGVGVSIDASQKAASASREKGRVVSASQRNEDAASRRKQAREARRLKARILQTSENVGVGGSSAELGATSALTTQISANIARIGGQQLASEGIADLNADIASADTQAAIGRGISTIGSISFEATGGFNNLFKGS